MALRQATLLIRDRQVSGGALPANALMGEPFVNLYDGILKFSGVTGGSFEPSDSPSIFEVGSVLYNSKITNRLNINNNFIISGGTGIISTYGGQSGSGLNGKFLSGTTSGFVLGNISDIQGAITRVQPGTNITTGGTENNPIINLSDSIYINNLFFSGTSTGGNIYSNNLSGETIYSGGTDLYDIFVKNVSAGDNILIQGTQSTPIVKVVDSPSFLGNVSATGFTDSSLTDGRVVFSTTLGRLSDDSSFLYNSITNTLSSENIVLGSPGKTGTTATIYGDILIVGESISGFTSELYIEDSLIELNFNPTASTTSTSLGSGFVIQDGSGISGTDAFLDIRGLSTGVSNRGFATNLNDIFIRESGTVSSPNGVRVIAEFDIVDGGDF